ncbi:MAG TPA: YfhO family protein [Thermoanaerobaculia bacterium]
MNLTWLYVAALYAAAVWLVRRARLELPKRVALLFYALVVAWLFRPLTGPYVNLATDILKLVAPWTAAGVTKFNVSNYETQDLLFQLMPWAEQVRASWRALTPPLWNELAGCGYPLAANMQSQAFSPLRLLALPLPFGYAVTAEAAMKMLLALTTMFLWCRRRYEVIPSIAGAIAFGFGTAIVVWLHFPLATVAAFLPSVFLQIDLLAERRTCGRFVYAAFLGPAVLAGGHPETAAHLVFFAVLYALWIAFAERRGVRLLGTLAAVSGVALLLSAPILAPFLETMRKTSRYQYLEVRAHEGATAYSDLPSLTPLVQPRFFGERPGPIHGPAVAETMCGFAGILGIGAWFGLAAHAIARRRFREREVFLLLAALFAFLIVDDVAIVSAPFRALFALALNFRLRVELAFFAAAMTAALLDVMKRERLPLYAAIAGALAAMIVIATRNVFPDAQAKHFALMTLIPSAVVLLAAVTRIRLAVAAALFAELWLAAHAWNPVRPLRELYPHTPLVDAMPRSGERIVGLGGALFPNTNAVFGLADVRVHDPMSNGRYIGLLTLLTGYDPHDYYAKWKDGESPLLDYLNVRWIVTEPGAVLARHRLLYDGPDGRLYENRSVLPRFFAARNVLLTPDYAKLPEIDLRTTAVVRILPVSEAAGRDLLSPRPATAPEARVTMTAKNAMRVDAPRHTLVVSSIAFWPGWRVTYNGRSLEPLQVNGAFLGFVVPPGSGVVRVRYLPLSFYGGAAVALLTIVVMIRAACSTRPGST